MTLNRFPWRKRSICRWHVISSKAYFLMSDVVCAQSYSSVYKAVKTLLRLGGIEQYIQWEPHLFGSCLGWRSLCAFVLWTYYKISFSVPLPPPSLIQKLVRGCKEKINTQSPFIIREISDRVSQFCSWDAAKLLFWNYYIGKKESEVCRVYLWKVWQKVTELIWVKRWRMLFNSCSGKMDNMDKTYTGMLQDRGYHAARRFKRAAHTETQSIKAVFLSLILPLHYSILAHTYLHVILPQLAW